MLSKKQVHLSLIVSVSVAMAGLFQQCAPAKFSHLSATEEGAINDPFGNSLPEDPEVGAPGVPVVDLPNMPVVNPPDAPVANPPVDAPITNQPPSVPVVQVPPQQPRPDHDRGPGSTNGNDRGNDVDDDRGPGQPADNPNRPDKGELACEMMREQYIISAQVACPGDASKKCVYTHKPHPQDPARCIAEKLTPVHSLKGILGGQGGHVLGPCSMPVECTEE